MSVRSLASQLAVRLAVVGGLLTVAGVTTYSATHWEPRMAYGHTLPASAPGR